MCRQTCHVYFKRRNIENTDDIVLFERHVPREFSEEIQVDRRSTPKSLGVEAEKMRNYLFPD